MAARVRDLLALYLEEDLGSGDITSEAIFPASQRSRARVFVKERTVVAGAAHAVDVFTRLGAKATVVVADGAWAESGATVLQVEGPTRAILGGERLALNLLSRMSGIATEVRLMAEELTRACAPAIVTGTRKTTPGFRPFEKEAIRIGGGDPHRVGLWDEAMVKDNHIAAAGSVGEAVRKVKTIHPAKRLTCEVESLEAAFDAAGAGADWLLIDNQTPEVGLDWMQKVSGKFPAVQFEASGGITPANVAKYGWADRVSMGWLTQKAQGKDFSLEIEPSAIDRTHGTHSPAGRTRSPTEGKSHT